jgi:hypothetical protein
VKTRQAIWLAVVLGLALSCKPFNRDEGGAPAGFDAATFEAAPPRQVIEDAGLVGGGGQGGGDDASVPDVAADLPADRPAPDAALDVAAERDPNDNTCDLLKQDCPIGRACYPGPSGRGFCQVPQPETSPCTDDVSCPGGRVCIDLICTPLCSTAGTCPGGERCQPYPMLPEVGYCVPGSLSRPDSGP